MATETPKNYFQELQQVNVNDHVDKKGKFPYLSWSYAFSELFSRYPEAAIHPREWDGFPAIKAPSGKGWMVHVSVTIGNVTRSQWHPVLDGNNKAIVEPDVFQINTSIQRAAVKAIALHGLGLYIYAGEDDPNYSPPEDADLLSEWLGRIGDCSTVAELEEAAKELAVAAVGGSDKKSLRAAYTQRLKELKS